MTHWTQPKRKVVHQLSEVCHASSSQNHLSSKQYKSNNTKQTIYRHTSKCHSLRNAMRTNYINFEGKNSINVFLGGAGVNKSCYRHIFSRSLLNLFGILLGVIFWVIIGFKRNCYGGKMTPNLPIEFVFFYWPPPPAAPSGTTLPSKHLLDYYRKREIMATMSCCLYKSIGVAKSFLNVKPMCKKKNQILTKTCLKQSFHK